MSAFSGQTVKDLNQALVHWIQQQYHHRSTTAPARR
jgi:hypothetical protein